MLQNWLLSAVNSSGAVSPLMHRQQHAGDHAGLGGAVAHLPITTARACRARPPLAQLIGHEEQHVLGGAHHHRNDDDRERDRPGEPGEVPIGATITS